MLRERVIKMQACACLWFPCRCVEISLMTSQERIQEQDRIAQDYLRTADTRTAQRRRDAVMAANVSERRGMDGLTDDERERARPLSQQFSPRGYQAWNHHNRRKAVGDQACAHCRVKDDQVQLAQIEDRAIPLHEGNCTALWKLAQRGQPRY